jgi:hypothetical protein
MPKYSKRAIHTGVVKNHVRSNALKGEKWSDCRKSYSSTHLKMNICLADKETLPNLPQYYEEKPD